MKYVTVIFLSKSGKMYKSTGEYTADTVIGECAGDAIRQIREDGRDPDGIVGIIQFRNFIPNGL